MAEFRRMNEAQLRKVRKLIKKLCANCLDKECLLLGDHCPQLISFTLICKYFRAAVLPADRELYAELMAVDARKHCAACGQPFLPRSNRALYCDRCRAANERRRTRDRVRRYRGSR